jgi:glyoxylase-like metal-dependent hydrolase (beta-lactamase superfamily II)
MAVPYTRGAHAVGDGVWAYLQPDGSWGWSNAGLIEPADAGAPALLVDTLFDVPLTRAMLEELERATPAAGRIGTVVNTHANGDHCWGNQLLAGADIVASAACADEMAELPPARLAELVAAAPALGRTGEYLARIFGPFDFASVTLALPTRTFVGSLTLEVGGRRVVLHEVGPAHTRGDVVVEVPDARVVFLGDILFVGAHPVIWTGPVGNWIAALDRVAAMDVDVVVPGHGPVTDKGGVREVRSYLVQLAAEARRRFEAGQPSFEAARELLAEMGSGPFAGWGEAERLAVNVAAVYRELGAREVPDVVTLFGQMAELAGGPSAG